MDKYASDPQERYRELPYKVVSKDQMSLDVPTAEQ
jgi:hypothetical protein